MNPVCEFCVKELSRLEDYYVCDNCKTVFISDSYYTTHKLSPDVSEKIKTFLERNHKELLLLNEKNPTDEEIVTLIKRIINIKGLLYLFLDNAQTKSIHFRKALYELLKISADYKKYKEKNCYNENI